MANSASTISRARMLKIGFLGFDGRLFLLIGRLRFFEEVYEVFALDRISR